MWTTAAWGHCIRFITTETQINFKHSSTVVLSQPTMQHSPRHNSLNRSTDQLLQKIATTDSHRCTQLYQNINRRTYTDKNPYKLGHSLSCSHENGCHSLLKHIRLVSCHFPAIRSLVNSIYKLRRLCLCLQSVQQAKLSGDYTYLKLSLIPLQQAEAAMWPGKDRAWGGKTQTDSEINRNTLPSNETSITEKYGTLLREVAKQQDTYIITACAMCKQLKPNLKSLKSLERRKGFTCSKRTEAIEWVQN